MKKRILSWLVVLCLILSSVPVTVFSSEEVTSGTCGENLTWTLDADGTLAISGTGEMTDWRSSLDTPWEYYSDMIKTVVVESGITSIGSRAFSRCRMLTNISLPDSIKTIGASSFYMCDALKSVTLPAELTTIGMGAFSNSGLASVNIPEKVSSIGTEAFGSCDALVEITVSNDNVHFQSQNGVLFNASLRTLIQYPGGKNGSYYIPSGVTTISESAFLGCGGLTNISLPDSVTYIGDGAFQHCANLTSIIIPSGVTTINNYVFQGCNRLNSIILPNGIISIGEESFGACALNDITLPKSVKSIGDHAFVACSSLNRITLSESMKSIAYGAFYDCSSLRSIVIPNGITDIAGNAFYNCNGLSEITFVGSAPTISADAFTNVTATCYYPANNASWNDTVKQNYGGTITWVAYNNEHVHEYDANHKCECGAIGGTCGDGLTWTLDQEGTLTISGTGKMTDWQDSENIADKAPWYIYRDQIKTVVIEKGVTRIGDLAFFQCGMSSIVLPDTIESIGWGAFFGCGNLKSIPFKGKAPTIGELAFYGVTATCYYPAGDPTWTDVIMQKYDGTITWVAVDADGEPLLGAGKCGENISWTLDEEGILTISGTGDMYDWEGPDAPWHNHRKNIKSVTIEPGVTSIGGNAFAHCVNLSKVDIPEGVIRIGYLAFSGTAILEIVLPASATNVSYEAFGSLLAGRGDWGSGTCDRLIKISVNPQNPVYASDSAGVLYTKDMSELIRCPGGFSGVYTIPKSVKAIGNMAFNWCEKLTEINLPDGITSIGSDVFNGCVSLENVKLPAQLSAVPNAIFANCSNLVKVSIPGGVESIGAYAFYECPKLEKVVFCGTEEKWKSFNYDLSNTSLNDEIVQYHDNVDGICTICGAASYVARGTCGDNLIWTLDEDGGLTISGTGAMENYDNYSDSPWYSIREAIETVEIQKGVTTIGCKAFGDCTRLNSVILEDSVISIGEHAFCYCSNLSRIIIPSSVLRIGDFAFSNTSENFCFYISDLAAWCQIAWGGVNALPYSWHIFLNNEHLKDVIIPKNISSVAPYAFWDNASISSVTIPGNVVSICSSAFESCSALAKVNIEEGVQKIESNAFSGCQNLTEVVLPESLISIGSGAFSDCSFEKIELPPMLTTIEQYTFRYCADLHSITFGENIEAISHYAFSNCSSLSRINFTSDMPAISDSAFTDVAAKAYYPCGKNDWEPYKLLNYGGMLSWEKVHNGYVPTTIAPTCTERGFTMHACVCGDSYTSNEIAALGHNEVVDNGYAATCTKDGLTEGKHCDRCNTVQTKQEVIPALGHSWDEGNVTKDPTEKETGICTYTCGICGETKSEEIPTLNHVHKHTSVVTAPTCVDSGYTTYTCSCGDSFVSDKVDALGHDEVADKGYAATCTEEGLTDGVHCDRCDTVLTKQETISSVGHSWDDGVVTAEPTENEVGIRTFTCETCGDTKIEEIPVLGHEHSYQAVITDPTCIADGYTTHTCTCGAYYVVKDEGSQDPDAHSFDSWITEDDMTCRICTMCGYEECKVSTDGGEVNIGSSEQPELVFAVEHVESTEDEYLLVKEALHSDSQADREILKVFDITLKNAEGISVQPNGIVQVKLPLGTEKNGTYKVYRVNDDGSLMDMNAIHQGSQMVFETDHFSIYVIVEETVHTHRLSVVTAVEATCETAGNKAYYVCSGCDKWFEDATGNTEIKDKSLVVIPALGHDFEKGACGNCGAEDPAEADLFELYGANMLLGNNLAMNFYIEPGDLEFGVGYYAVITKTYADREDLEIIIEDDEWEEAYNMYRVSLDKIAAKEMADEITVVIYNDEDEQVSKTWVDSVRDYTMRVLVKEEAKTTSDKELLALYVEMLNYGAAAQEHFEYNEDDLANNVLTEAQQAYGLGKVPMEDFRVAGTGYVGTNLVLESNILMNFFFNNIPAEHDDMYAIATYTDHYGEAKQIKVEGEEFIKHNSSTWKVSVAGLVVADCREFVTVKVYEADGDVIASVTDSIESYTARMDGDGPLYVAIMNFAVAAYNSFH